MTKRFHLEIAYSHDHVGIRVIGSCQDYHGMSATLKLTGDLTPDEAIAFADALRAKAEQVKAANAKREAEQQRRAARSAKLPQISLRDAMQ